MWWVAAGQYQGLPLESRDALAILGVERPQLAKPRSRYIYYPGCGEVPESVAVSVRNRSYTIAAELDVTSAHANGVLFAQGARFGGHALYVKDGILKYVYNFAGMFEQVVEATEPLPLGHVWVSASFDKEGDGMPTEGTLTLHIRDADVGSARIKTQPGKFSLAGEGLNVGRDGGEAVTDDFPGSSPWAFTGGTIAQVAVDVSGDQFIDLAREAQAMFARE